MLITYSQIIIFVCVLFFIVFNLVAVYFYQETYNTRTIKNLDTNLAWSFIKNLPTNNDWWSKLASLPQEKKDIHIINNFDNISLTIIFKNSNTNEEIWHFTLNQNQDSPFIHVKKQTLVTSKFKDFINKYLRNNKDLVFFEKNLRDKISSALSNNSNVLLKNTQ